VRPLTQKSLPDYLEFASKINAERSTNHFTRLLGWKRLIKAFLKLKTKGEKYGTIPS
jgi:hypothetical protein